MPSSHVLLSRECHGGSMIHVCFAVSADLQAKAAKWLLDHGEVCGLPVVRIKNKFAVKDSSEYDGCVSPLRVALCLKVVARMYMCAMDPRHCVREASSARAAQRSADACGMRVR
eukprot:3522344-Rhodomonas_salina.1